MVVWWNTEKDRRQGRQDLGKKWNTERDRRDRVRKTKAGGMVGYRVSVKRRGKKTKAGGKLGHRERWAPGEGRQKLVKRWARPQS